MKLYSSIPIHFDLPGISYDDRICMLGSCFTTEIGQKLKEGGFDVLMHSHGIIYNPVSIRKSLYDIIHNYQYQADDLLVFNDKWLSLHHHGSFSDSQIHKALARINDSIAGFYEALSKPGLLFITLGTAWIYRHLSSNQIVANCHKIPSTAFKKELLNLEEETTAWLAMIDKLRVFNPQLRIVFTISPVKHIHDGFFENNLSKGLLHALINNIRSQKNLPGYFPSFEIMQDELRDYRFYNADLTHPNVLAVNYIWERFSQQYFTYATQELYKHISRILLLWQHRVLDSSSMETKQFIVKRMYETEQFKRKYPDIAVRIFKDIHFE
ncbi:MAG: GSCFA domain-containing protein [Flavobacteriales bacterium]|nr:GSCFA domain-containing protein [Flavobacteriales bacterium]